MTDEPAITATGRGRLLQMLEEGKLREESLTRTVIALQAALLPLESIANAYDHNALDDARPEWGEHDPGKNPPTCVLFLGRGGRTLLTLAQTFAARDALKESRHASTIPSPSPAPEAPPSPTTLVSLSSHDDGENDDEVLR